MGNTPVVSLQHAQKAFGNNAVLKDISLTVEQGDVLSIIGPSGGGKSTLLRCMTLLETLDAGSLSYGDLQVVTASEAKGKAVYGGKDVLAQAKKRYGLVFQNFNLFPHYTVLQNVTDALICVQKKPKEEALAKGRELLAKMGLTGKEMERRLDEVHITANKNAIPFDPEKPFVTSGIRVGTPAATSRGFKEADFVKIAELMRLAATDIEGKADEIRAEVCKLCDAHPIYR